MGEAPSSLSPGKTASPSPWGPRGSCHWSGSLGTPGQTCSSLPTSEQHLLGNVLCADPTPSFVSFYPTFSYILFYLCRQCCKLNVYVPQVVMCGHLIPPVMHLGGGVIRWGGWSLTDRPGASGKRHSLLPPFWQVGTQGEEGREPARGSPDPTPAQPGPWPWTSWPPGVWGVNFCCL